MSQTIQSFIEGFNGGTRVNRFRVEGALKYGGALTTFHIRSASMPTSTIGAISINYRGRIVNFPGDRVFLPWEITILDDMDSAGGFGSSASSANSLYNNFHRWHNNISASVNNNTTSLAPKGHFASDWTVSQLDTNGNGIIRRMRLRNCWPQVVGPIVLDMGTDNTIASFAVSMQFTDFELLT